jgi:hypothetical protein
MSRLLLRASLLSLAIFAATTLPAAAFQKVNIGTRTKEYMKDLCTGGGRQYVEGQGQYGCISNCGDAGKTSDACGINCSEQTNQCYGWSPGTGRRVSRPNDILGPRLGGGVFEGGLGRPPQGPATTGMAPPPSLTIPAGR